jgi:hypothetical protein
VSGWYEDWQQFLRRMSLATHDLHTRNPIAVIRETILQTLKTDVYLHDKGFSGFGSSN